ncbi:MAG: tyrosine-type recombinase/integrase [Desulfonauticus sp.]|nr:tyrosine-type recombinase/integrase [Desulfonauticus sp.]
MLTNVKIKNTKPKEKPYKIFDSYGLYLEIRPSGKKIWRIKIKNRTITLGEYPLISLLEARKQTLEIKTKIRQDGIIVKRFKEVAIEFLQIKRQEWKESHFVGQKAKLENYVFDIIGQKRIDEITKQDVNLVLENVLKRNLSPKPGPKIELRRKIFFLIQQILRYAVNKDYTKYNICNNIDIQEILPRVEPKHIKAITDEKKFKDMVKALFELEGVYPTVHLALKFLILTGLRSGNVRNLQWSWLDKKNNIFAIPANYMKTKKDFRLPLTKNTLSILQQAEKIKKSQYVFYSPSHPSRPLSESVFIVLLKRLGVFNHQPHGFRSSFSTLCYLKQPEHGFGAEVIETQLAHVIGTKVTRAYMRSDFLEERRQLLEWWEKFLGVV